MLTPVGTSSCHQLQPLCDQAELGDAGDVAARPVEARDQTQLDRVGARAEDNRNCRGRPLGCERGVGATDRGDGGDPAIDQLGRQFQ